MPRSKTHVAVVVIPVTLLIIGAATIVKLSVAGESDHALPLAAREQLAKQKKAMRAVYLEFTEARRGTLPNWDYDPAPAISAYFEGNRFYREERIPGFDQYNNKIAFDGGTIWRREHDTITKCPFADAASQTRFQYFKWPYLDAAGLYAPGYTSELEHYSSLVPLALYYLEHSVSTKVETVEDNLRVTFQVADEIANLQETELVKDRNDLPRVSAHQPPAVTENVRGDRTAKPTRKVVLLLDPKRGYGIVDREEWNAAGQRTGHIQCEDWKFFENADIWLPSRCIASYYARPTLFITDLTESPVHVVTTELKRVEFGKKKIPFTLEQTTPDVDIIKLTVSKTTSAGAIPIAGQESVDIATIERIKTEAAQHSQAMDTVSWLTDVYGARLTGSPSTREASDWVVAKLRSWGLSNVRLEAWGPYDRGWMNEQFAFRAVTPRPFIINAVPSVGSPSTRGRVTGPAIRFDVHSFADMQQRYSGKLKGAFLLVDPVRPTPAHFNPQAHRFTDTQLDGLASGQLPPRTPRIIEIAYDPMQEAAWLVEEGVAALLFAAPGDGGTINFEGRGSASSQKRNDPVQLPTVKVSAESYGRIARILERNIPVTLELDMQNSFYDDPGVFNVIAEIRGTDPRLRNEVVMIGAHLDSWTFGTGATDNAAGSAVMMEAMRILSSLHLQPRRTIQVALWTGEEQGALGSKAYVQQHFQDPAKSERDAFSVYFNLDGGTGKIRGILNARNASVGPIFDAWMGPFKDLGMKTVSPCNIGGGDQLSFERAGLPSFGFIQDPIEYETRTHHTSADVYERIQPEDMQFNAAVLASFAWQAAQRNEKLPRAAPPP